MSTSPNATVPLGKLRDSTSKPSKPSEGPGKRRKIQMSQRVILDLDPGRKSDRAEVAILHADIIHNDRNA